jgi:hypothetical protein
MIIEDKILKRINDLENGRFNIAGIDYRIEELKLILKLIRDEYDDCK